ncbi:OPT family oligopeptide transporter [Tautonia plasticadhaerens]|uniref:OPT oligopeptide transporter protein n=1 Tax=Tautonia plasticadhaerens TaxID=2527974 RepID=A0A518GVE5_9BACT|nr:oligopeptide transporter, OPT family [Tautonia plasticadhaerens]QDV32554.1 OPT oligopeptide transporter protein [Tautonia plasticadhaerens]
MAVQPPPESSPIGATGADGDGDGVRPYVPDSASMPELTWSAVLLGAVLGIVFGASSLYLVLRVGMTVSASIPVAVLSITLFRAFSGAFGTRRATILENNVVQTAGSAGESIAFGVGVTMPALLILGYDMELAHVMLVAGLGGLLGILMMIPLRRAFIVRKHRELKYPEGTACAKVLIVGEQGGASARTVFAGFGLAAAYQFLMQAMRLWVDIPSRAIAGFKGAVVAVEVSPALLGVGYIIGPRISSIMVAGGVLSALVLTPTIAYFGADAPAAIAPAVAPIGEMGPDDIQRDYILYIGAGAVATGGIISVFQVLPMILASAGSAFRDLSSRGRSAGGDGEPKSGRTRTERDLPLSFVLLGSIGLVAAIAGSTLIPTDALGRVAGAILVVLFGFLFVTVSSRLTGEIGSSSNPISGMTVATLLLTCLVFVLRGWVGPEYQFAALSIAAVVCIAASNGGTTSQDLKTGFLVGGTPSKQQWAILVGALTSAMVIGGTLLLLNDAGTIYTTKAEYQRPITVDPETLTETTTRDGTEYRVWRLRDGIQGGKYLVPMDAKRGDSTRVYVDPAINGRVQETDDGRRVSKYNAPKATLMATIIDGIMGNTLPWGLVLIGVFIAVVLQLAGVPALPFAVGVYLPLAASAPIFVGGMARGLVDRLRGASPEESDSSPAVLMSSGYIAGGTITAILVTILLTFVPALADLLDVPGRFPSPPPWAENPWIGLGAFGVMAALLVLVGLGVILKDREPKAVEEGTTGHYEAPDE